MTKENGGFKLKNVSKGKLFKGNYSEGDTKDNDFFNEAVENGSVGKSFKEVEN